jgi:hypothetical protein
LAGYVKAYFTGVFLRAFLSAQTNVLHREWTGIFFSAGSSFRDGSDQLPFAEITRVSYDFERLGVCRREKRAEPDRQKKRSH